MIAERQLPAEYHQLLEEFRSVYLPVSSVAESIVRDIAMARWQILHLDDLIIRNWNPVSADPACDHAAIHRFNRQIDQLNVRIARLERRLKFIRVNFSTVIDEQTSQDAGEPDEDTANPDKLIPLNEYRPGMVEFYHRYYPHSRIVIMPLLKPPPKAPDARAA